MKRELTETNINQIIFLKGLKLTAWQISRILNLSEADVKRIMESKIFKKSPKKYVFDWKDFNNSII